MRLKDRTFEMLTAVSMAMPFSGICCLRLHSSMHQMEAARSSKRCDYLYSYDASHFVGNQYQNLEYTLYT